MLPRNLTATHTAVTHRSPALIAACLCLLACLVAPGVKSAGTLEPWTATAPLPAFSLPDGSGKMHQLVDYKGKVVLVNFWASWCPPCIREMPSLQRLQEKLGDQPFVILTINVGEKKYKVWKFTKLIDFNLPVLLDTRSETFNAWEASVLPTSFLLDTEGRIRYRVVADLDWDSEAVISRIRTLLPEQQDSE